MAGAHPRREEEWTLQSLGNYLQTIPTKKDFELYVSRLEDTYKQEIQILKLDIQGIGERVDDTERQASTLSSYVQDHHSALQYLLRKEEEHASHLDDIENRNRRNNIRVRGIPEIILHKDLDLTLQKIFASLMDSSPSNSIELDRAHRALGPRPSENDRPRDVICRVHYFKQKDQIMSAARSKGPVSLDGYQVNLLPDLSRRTLQLRRALKPLLEALKAQNVLYRWGYPFALFAHKGDKSATFRSLGDLPNILSTFSLPMISLPDWPKVPSLLDPPRFEQWQEVHKKKKKTSPTRSSAGSSSSASIT